MSQVQDAFKHNKARKNVIRAGIVIIVGITLISCVSSFMIYREGFSDMPPLFQRILALLAVVAVEGGFCYLVYGFTRAFSSALERIISFGGMIFLVFTMMINIVTHFMMAKHLPLTDFQHTWLQWGAVTVFIAVLGLVLAITLADPVIRLIRQELKVLGKQQEVILDAREAGMNSPAVMDAFEELAAAEARKLAGEILKRANLLPPAPSGTTAQSRPVGFAGGNQSGQGNQNKPTNQSGGFGIYGKRNSKN